jgi:hypothetical protein
MSIPLLVSELEKTGWQDFAPGTLFETEFDTIGKARLAKNNWFALIKAVPVLGIKEIEMWHTAYQAFAKKSLSRMFARGKYFVLILLVDTLGADAVAWLSQGNSPDFLQIEGTITNGGGFTMLLLKDRKKIFMPKNLKVWNALQATKFIRGTYRALVNYKNSLNVGQ